jgi:response regulator RpfG family c-di-GMP phosphodiesterase
VSPVTESQQQAAGERRYEREREARKVAELQLEERSRELFVAQKKLEQQYAKTIEVFASLMSGRSGRSRTSLRELARRTKKFGEALNLDNTEVNDLHLSAMLCDIGKITLSDEVLATPIFEMSKEQFSIFSSHPRLAYEALLTLEPLASVAKIVRDHAELFDGSGYPKGKRWDDISLSARILCMEKDHDAMMNGILTPKAATEAGARQFMLDNRGTRYDAEMVDLWIDLQDSFDADQTASDEKALHPSALIEGMVLTRDLTSTDGVLMLGAGQVLSQQLIEKLSELDRSANEEFVLYILPAPELEPSTKS